MHSKETCIVLSLVMKVQFFLVQLVTWQSVSVAGEAYIYYVNGTSTQYYSQGFVRECLAVGFNAVHWGYTSCVRWWTNNGTFLNVSSRLDGGRVYTDANNSLYFKELQLNDAGQWLCLLSDMTSSVNVTLSLTVHDIPQENFVLRGIIGGLTTLVYLVIVLICYLFYTYPCPYIGRAYLNQATHPEDCYSSKVDWEQMTSGSWEETSLASERTRIWANQSFETKYGAAMYDNALKQQTP
ncbi:uncharacterized protein LOC106173885 [Lingula anatina]|uniref:Uncharacterized protein LOC106173885 n=1 Tax=Lingula anatina TaxID=7574 RepID=A0A1S3JKK9_LINAN|nr:uncharacterized protein LOC106173885 [Lingula anatina]|eukprot:XP_013410661.1 uncharacterized protein LOC106173885 [Lingula anatina]